jgi:hypothetical protein
MYFKMTPKRSMDEIFADVFTGGFCSSAELEYAAASIAGGDRLTQIRAVGIIIAKGNENQKRVAFGILEQLITSPDVLSINEEFVALEILMQFRRDFHFAEPFLNFVLHASKSATPELRCNASVIFMNLAKHNQIAKNALEKLTEDSDESVRRNAITGLNSL